MSRNGSGDEHVEVLWDNGDSNFVMDLCRTENPTPPYATTKSARIISP